MVQQTVALVVIQPTSPSEGDPTGAASTKKRWGGYWWLVMAINGY